MCDCSVFPVINLVKTGDNIRKIRMDAGVTVRDLQTYFGFEYPQAIYKWQRGECLPSVDNLLALARVLGVPMEDLLVYDDQEVGPFLGMSRYHSPCRLNGIGGGTASPANTTPLTDLPEILWISGRQICKAGIFALVVRLPDAKIPAFPPRMSPGTIEHQRGSAPPISSRQFVL